MFPSAQVDPFTSPQTRRNFLKYSISEDDWRNKSGASILRSMREGAGIAIREGDFYRLRTEKLEEINRKDQIQNVGDDDLIPYSLMNSDTGITLTNKAQYRLRMTVRDGETGELSYVYRSIGDDQHHTRGFIEEFAQTMFSMGGAGYNYDIIETVLHDVWLTPGASLST